MRFSNRSIVPSKRELASVAAPLASRIAFYRFVPYLGLDKITAYEAQALVDEARDLAAKKTAAALKHAQASAAHARAVAALMATD